MKGAMKHETRLDSVGGGFKLCPESYDFLEIGRPRMCAKPRTVATTEDGVHRIHRVRTIEVNRKTVKSSNIPGMTTSVIANPFHLPVSRQTFGFGLRIRGWLLGWPTTGPEPLGWQCAIHCSGREG